MFIETSWTKTVKMIRILEWFLKDHVTLTTRVMMLKMQLYLTGINYILKCIKIEDSCSKILIFQNNAIFDQIKAALVSIRDLC